MKQQEEEQIIQKIRVTSQHLYRSALSKAGAGDLSRAVDDLEKAVRYDKYNEKARNLLGLVQFQRGELGEAMKQWSISEHLNKTANWATYYLKEIKKEETMLKDMSTSIHLYNEASQLAHKDSIDFAITRLKKAVHLNPRFVRARLLLAMCYIETQHYKTALRALDQVAKVDPLNPDAMRYRLYIARQRREGVPDAGLGEIQDLSRDLYVQQALPEPDKEEIFRERRKRKKAVRNISGPMMQILLFFAGALCAAGFVRMLWYPSEIQQLKDETRQLQISQEALRKDKEDLQKQNQEAAELLLEIAKQSREGKPVQASVLAEAEQILKDWGIEVKDES